MASASQVLSVSAGIGRGVETKSATTEASAEQPFGQVLAREVSRKGGEQQAGEKAAAESAKTETASAEAATTTEAQTADASATGEQQAMVDAVAMPWLLMMQQTAQATQIMPQMQGLTDAAKIAPEGAKATVLAAQGQGKAATAQPFGELASTGNGEPGAPVTGGLGQMLAANSVTESGKALPQDLSASLEKMSFSGILAGRLDNDKDALGSEEGAKSQNWLAVSQPAIRSPESSGEQVAKTAAQHVVAEPVGDSRWGDAVAQRVSMMLGRQEQQVEMQLNPPHLGPMEVRLTLGQEQASVVFASQHAAVREALEAATPKLTALLADQGIQLVNVQVASDSLHQHAQEQSRQQQASSFQSAGQGGQNGRAFDGESAAPYWRTETTVPVARSGVSLYV
ncbi:flagellar hook-length control protein FliK [Formivibrio citricus]|nr:flagellar hook-length control protein FliK [Formivibrio citricus]